MLNGELTRLRRLEENDLDCYCIWVNDSELARLVLGTTTPYSKRQAMELWHRQSPEHDLLFTIETLSQEPIGFCFLRNMHPVYRFAELEQFFIGKEEHRNNGYGRDAIETLVRYCFTDLNLNRIWLITYAYNLAGIHFYEKCGFLKEGVLRQIQFTKGEFHNGIIMAILRKDWLARIEKGEINR